jgi:hypothetical protein
VIGFSALVCPGCGAALPPEALLSVVTCSYCRAAVTCDDSFVSAAGFRRALADLDDNPAGEPRTWIDDVPYRILGKLATGKHTDVFLAERARPLTERVVIKKARDPASAARLERAWEMLTRLHESTARGAEHFTTRLPQLVSFGTAIADDDAERPAIVWRYASGFIHTFEDVRREYPAGVDGRHGSWMWRRLLELLGFVHSSGFVHGAVTPEHALVHARDHGVMLVGWSDARRIDGSPIDDIAASARAIAYVLGGDPSRGTVPSSVPAPIADLVSAIATSPRAHDAWALRGAVESAARLVYGPSAYHELAMPGWSGR